MPSKEEIHLRYLESVMVAPELREVQKALVVGTRPDSMQVNIAEAISGELSVRGFDVLDASKQDMDVIYPGEVNRFFKINEDELYDTDTLVYCAGYNELDWFENQTQDAMFRQVGVNLVGAMYVAQRFVQATLNNPYLKHIVFIGSMAHRQVLNASAPYCASKAGLAMLARCLGWELTPKNYRVFCVHPSNTEDTPMTEHTIQGIMNYRGINRQEAEEYWGAINLMPEWLQKEDIAQVVAWLVSGDTAPQFLSGTQIELTGGQR